MLDGTPVLRRGVGVARKCRACGVLIMFGHAPVTGTRTAYQLDARGAWAMRNGDAVRVEVVTLAPGESRYARHEHDGAAL